MKTATALSTSVTGTTSKSKNGVKGDPFEDDCRIVRLEDRDPALPVGAGVVRLELERRVQFVNSWSERF
jgi:hypothetical protein